MSDPAVVDLDEEKFTRALTRTLAHAFYWVDDGLQNYMTGEADFSLPRSQSMLMISIGDGISRQSDIARHLNISKQAVRQGIIALEEKGLIRIEPDPENGRQKILVFTERGAHMRQIAREGLLRVEQILEARIGKTQLNALRSALEADWGPAPSADALRRAGSPGPNQ